MYSFFAMLGRMKYIDRWALMRNTRRENLSEHSADVAAIAHAIALIKNTRFGGDVNAERAAFLGLYHDMPEIITGDMPTPVKYMARSFTGAYKQIEKSANDTLLGFLPDVLRPDYEKLFDHDADEKTYTLVKAADRLAAYIEADLDKKSLSDLCGFCLMECRKPITLVTRGKATAELSFAAEYFEYAQRLGFFIAAAVPDDRDAERQAGQRLGDGAGKVARRD